MNPNRMWRLSLANALPTFVLLVLLVPALYAQADDIPRDILAEDPAIRSAAIESLPAGEELDQKLIAKLQSLAIEDKNPRVRAAACEQLGIHRDATSIPMLIQACRDRALFDDEHHVFEIAGEAIAKFKSEPIPTLRKMLATGEQQQIQHAAFALEFLGPHAANLVELLSPMLESDDALIVTAAINSLRRIGPPAKPAVPRLQKLLKHENFHLVYWSCRALGGIGEGAAEAVPDLIQCVKEGNGSVRRNALEALGNIGEKAGDDAVAIVMKAVNDPLHPVKEKAVLALGNMLPRSKKAKPLLEKAIGSSSYSAKSAAAVTLWKIEPGSQLARSTILNELKNPSVSLEATKAVEQAGDAMKLEPDLAKFLESQDILLRESAVWALASLKHVSAATRTKLKAIAAGDSQPHIREAAEAALNSLSGE